MKELPRTCIFCRNFPCVTGDDSATVTSELSGEYPFLSEDDRFKTCNGDYFKPYEFDLVEEQELEEAIEQPVAYPTPDFSYKVPYILKSNDPDILQSQVDKLVQDEDVIGFEISGLTSIYDAEASRTVIVMALVIQYSDKDGKLKKGEER